MLILNLRLFDGAAGAAGAAGVAAGMAEGSAPSTEAHAPDVAQADNQTAQPTHEERKARYAQLKAEYKDEFGADIQQLLDARFKEANKLKDRVKQVDPILITLAAKYGVDPKDTAALQTAIDTDVTYLEREAEQAGLTPEQLLKTKKLEAENAAFRAQREQEEVAAEAQHKVAQWNEQAEALKALYPDFDLAAEANDPVNGAKFIELISMPSGLVNVQQAYELLHPEKVGERIQRGVAYVAKETQKQTINSIKANGLRPSENGAGMPANTKVDVSKFTPEQRREINERALRGEVIDLKTGF